MGEITHAQVRANLNARLASGEFQIVERSQSIPGRQFTTAKTIEAEHEIIRRVREGQNDIEPVLPRPQAIVLADQHPHLNPAQKTVVEDVLSSPDAFQVSKASSAQARDLLRSNPQRRGEPIVSGRRAFARYSAPRDKLNEAGIEAGPARFCRHRRLKLGRAKALLSCR